MMSPRALAAAFALPLLSGCVAAAVPVLAAGGLIKSQSDGDARSAHSRPRVAIPAEPATVADRANAFAGPVEGESDAAPGALVRDYTLGDGTQVTVTNALAPAATPRPRPIAATPLPVTGGEPKVTYLAGMTRLPEPSAVVSGGTPVSPAARYADFTAFARTQASIPGAGAERMSALLMDSSRLLPETRACSIHPSAVMIDLDPAGGMLDTARPLSADPGLAADLAQLRSEGVEIGWVSGRTADRAGAIRKALVAAGLDPDGRDQLVLLRFPEERKQTRRDDFAKENCVLAIAGDERADFDELFTYLRDPAAATPLDALIGKRWFLVPPPLN